MSDAIARWSEGWCPIPSHGQLVTRQEPMEGRYCPECEVFWDYRAMFEGAQRLVIEMRHVFDDQVLHHIQMTGRTDDSRRLELGVRDFRREFDREVGARLQFDG